LIFLRMVLIDGNDKLWSATNPPPEEAQTSPEATPVPNATKTKKGK
jgi:hypothetical protein